MIDSDVVHEQDALIGVRARIRRNLKVDFGERLIFAAVNLCATALAARTVGIEALGVVGTLIAFSAVIAAIFAFQSWQAVVYYGAAALKTRDEAALQRLFGLTLATDALAMAASLALAFAVAPWVGMMMCWPDAVTKLVSAAMETADTS